MTTKSSRREPRNPTDKEQELAYSARFLARRRQAQEVKESTAPYSGRSKESLTGRYLRGAPHPSLNSEKQRERIRTRRNRVSDLPRLSKKAERQLEASYQHLSPVRGEIASLKKDTKTIYITSCFDAEGKTTAAIHTAFALSLSGDSNVLLIDGNIESPQIHRMFGTELSPGLTDVFFSDLSFEDVLAPTQYQGLSIITAGRIPSDTLLPLAKYGFKAKLDEMCSQFDYIIFDGNSMLASSEAATIAVDFDAVILVVACEQTKWEVVQMVQRKIEQTGANLLGIILNKRNFYIPDSVYRRLSKG